MVKPNRPSIFEGERDILAVNSWLYQMGQFLDLSQADEPDKPLTEQTRVQIASTFLSGTASSWWFTKVQNQEVPTTWENFQTSLCSEFVPQDSLRRYRDKLRRISQKSSVERYLAEFRNTVILIPNMTEDEKIDRFCVGLKPQIRLEVLKSGVQKFDEVTRIALNVDSALFGSGMFSDGAVRQLNTRVDRPEPMEIGNVEREPRNRNKQREVDMKNNACFKCHKPGCRPWKCSKNGGAKKKKYVSSNHVDVDNTRAGDPSVSEN